jgi:integrase
MFLRFLIAEGRCHAGLLSAIPVVPCWRLTSLPRYLPPEDVERIIACCNATSRIGTRDRAILLLLARLGLRAGDIVQMRLTDIDWKNAWIQVSGKSRRQTRLPLTHEIGQAIVAYVQIGRYPAQTDALFLRSRAPLRVQCCGRVRHCRTFPQSFATVRSKPRKSMPKSMSQDCSK